MLKAGAITDFRGEHFFLSNYYTAQFNWRGVTFSSSEQAFAYAKTFFATNRKEAEKVQALILKAPSPGEAKKLGRQVNIDIDAWNNQKFWYMREIVHEKFRQVPGLVGQLMNTGVKMLVEVNTWNDKIWGRCLVDGRMVGSNALGVILMEERGLWSRGELGV